MKKVIIFLCLFPSAILGMEPEERHKAEKRFVFNQQECECPICIEVIKKGEEYSCFPCQHVFHFGCYKKLSSFNRFSVSCPLCRRQLSYLEKSALDAKASGKILYKAVGPVTQQSFFSKVRSAFGIPLDEDLQAKLAIIEKENAALKDQLKLHHNCNVLLEDERAKVIKLKKAYEDLKLIKPDVAQLDNYKQWLDKAATDLEESRLNVMQLNAFIINLQTQAASLALQKERLEKANADEAKLLAEMLADNLHTKEVLFLGSSVLGGLLVRMGVSHYTINKKMADGAGLLTGGSLLVASSIYLKKWHADEQEKIKALTFRR